MPSQVVERELPLIQRGIVDNCFEEGHYEYGIEVLDKLRGEQYKPLPLHIRQLVYIALYPPPPKSPKRVDSADAPPPSPQKVQLQRQKDDLWPKPASRPLAIALLTALADTNLPVSLMRGLPYHSYVDNDGIMDVDPFRGEKQSTDFTEDNSPLKNEVMAIQQLKNCWDFLRGGFVKRKQTDRSRINELDVDVEGQDYGVLGPYAWPVLEWLIHVFEKDQQRAEEEGQAPHSALLLCQIPAPRTKKGPRWDVETALKVALACLSPSRTINPSYRYASSEKQSHLGTRLLSLLVNLTLTKPPLLSPSHLLRFLSNRFPDLSLPALETLLSAVLPSQAIFKVLLLEKYIFQGSGSSNDAQATEPSTVPAPRAKPKFTGKAATKDVPSPVVSTGTQGKDAYSIPSPETLLKLLSSPLPPPLTQTSGDPSSASAVISASSTTTKIALAKSQLVSTLLTLNLLHRLVGPGWPTAAREGKLRKCVTDGFALPETSHKVDEMVVDCKEGEKRDIKRYMLAALEAVTIWESSSR